MFISRYIFVTIAAFLISLITFFHPSFWFGNRQVMNDLFNREELVSENASGIWKQGDPASLLVTSILIRLVVFFIMVNSPVPSGVFAPGVVIGGLIGRAYAEISEEYLGLALNKRMMAVAGAASFSGVITKTTSPILIMLEITGEMGYLYGLLVSVLIANAIAGVYTMSFFDTVLNIKK